MSREGIYTAIPISARPAASARVLERPAQSRHRDYPRRRPVARDVLPPREGLPAAWVPLKTRSISHRFPKNFRPVFENFSASFENRIFYFPDPR